MKRRIPTLVATLGLLLAVASLGASATQAAGEPGFLPGTWVGNGTIKGSVTDGPAAAGFGGPIRFTLEVDKKLQVSGSGSWKLQTFGYERADDDAVDAKVKGWAAIGFAGTSKRVTFSGTQYVIGEVMGSGVQWPLRFETELDSRLVITRAGQCTLSGSTRVHTGVHLRWSAKLEASDCSSA